MLKFEAEKFCARMSLKLGFDSMELAEIFLGKFLQSKGLCGVVTKSKIIWHDIKTQFEQIWNQFGPKRWELTPCQTHLNVMQSRRNQIHFFWTFSLPNWPFQLSRRPSKKRGRQLQAETGLRVHSALGVAQ
jgi:hypothetical protein